MCSYYLNLTAEQYSASLLSALNFLNVKYPESVYLVLNRTVANLGLVQYANLGALLGIALIEITGVVLSRRVIFLGDRFLKPFSFLEKWQNNFLFGWLYDVYKQYTKFKGGGKGFFNTGKRSIYIIAKAYIVIMTLLAYYVYSITIRFLVFHLADLLCKWILKINSSYFHLADLMKEHDVAEAIKRFFDVYKWFILSILFSFIIISIVTNIIALIKSYKECKGEGKSMKEVKL